MVCSRQAGAKACAPHFENAAHTSQLLKQCNLPGFQNRPGARGVSCKFEKVNSRRYLPAKLIPAIPLQGLYAGRLLLIHQCPARRESNPFADLSAGGLHCRGASQGCHGHGGALLSVRALGGLAGNPPPLRNSPPGEGASSPLFPNCPPILGKLF